MVVMMMIVMGLKGQLSRTVRPEDDQLLRPSNYQLQMEKEKIQKESQNQEQERRPGVGAKRMTQGQ